MIQAQLRMLTVQNILYKGKNIAIFDKVDVIYSFVRNDARQYPIVFVNNNYFQSDYLDQSRGVKTFYKEYSGKKLFNLILSYPDVKN